MKPNYLSNLESLASRHAPLAHQLSLLNLNEEMHLESTRHGELTLIVKDVAMHSRYHPSKEAQKELQHIPAHHQIIILAGLGLGYLALEIIAQRPECHCIIIEPNLDYLLIAQHALDLKPLYIHPHVDIIWQNNPEVLQKYLLQAHSSQIYWHELRARVSLEKELFIGFHNIYREYLQRIQTNQLALKQYGFLWWRNSIKNLSYWNQAKAVHQLFQTAQAYPILVVGAGPSLSYHRHHLHELAKRMIIICVDTALRILLADNLRPDFVISIDSQYWNARHLDQLHLEGIPYIVDSAVHPMLLHKIDPQNLYMMSPIVPLMQSIDTSTFRFGALRSGGSVSITAWDLALHMNPTSIWLLGIDLAYPNQATHAKGALFEQWLLSQSNRFQSMFTGQVALKHAQTITLSDNHGNPVTSDARMRLYLRWMEEALRNESIASYNLSTLGVRIEGMPYKDIKHALALPTIRTQAGIRLIMDNSDFTTSNTTSNNIFSALIRLSQDNLQAFIDQVEHCPPESLLTLRAHPAIQYFSPILPFWFEQVVSASDVKQEKATLLTRLHRLVELYKDQ